MQAPGGVAWFSLVVLKYEALNPKPYTPTPKL